MNLIELKPSQEIDRLLPMSIFRTFIALLCVGLVFGCEDAEDQTLINLENPNGRSINLPGSNMGSGPGDRPLGAADSPLPEIQSQNSPREGVGFAGQSCEGALSQACDDGCGVQRCRAGVWTECESGLESCNGHDDDCDGLADEGLGEGTSCSLGDDSGCSGIGILTCDASQGSMVCDGDIPAASSEICDGIDNDCDGTPDEDFPNERCCTEGYHCPPSATCENNRCIGGNAGSTSPGFSTGGACNNLLDCEFGQTCLAGACALLCLDQTDCPGNLLCGCPPSNPSCIFPGCLEPNSIANNQSPGCQNTCEYAGDGDCDDGGPNSDYSFCDVGTDCADCGPR